MTDLSSLGYPQAYHAGLSFVLWNIFIGMMVILGFFLYMTARKSDLINVKEMFYAKSFLFICTGIYTSMIQVGVIFHENFAIFSFIGIVFSNFSIVIYMNYWEKNLTSINRIPTITAGISTVLAFTALIISLISPIILKDLTDLIAIIIFILLTISYGMYIYLIYGFSKNVKGSGNKTTGMVWMVGIILLLIAIYIDNPPLVTIMAEFNVLYIAPIFLTVANILSFYGVNRLFVQISSYYTHTQRCLVHRGEIGKGNPMYSCPSCGIVYCIPCYEQVIKKDGCWNCGEGSALEGEDEIKDYPVIESEEITEPKKNLTKRADK